MSEGHASAAIRDPSDDERFLFFVVDDLYDEIDADIPALDETYTTAEMVAVLRQKFIDWERCYGRYACRGWAQQNGSNPTHPDDT